jgi:hypothetical protein
VSSFFLRLAHCFMGDSIDDLLLDECVFQEIQPPALVSFGRSAARQGNEMGFAFSVEDTLFAFFLFFAKNSLLKAALTEALANTAQRLVQVGANGLVLFNRFFQPDLDLESQRSIICPVLSRSDDLRLPLRWIALLYGTVSADLALTGGVHTYEDVLKAMFVGANVAMLASELLQNGTGRVGEILREMMGWMERHGPDSVVRLRGLARQFSSAEPAAFERGSYTKAVLSLDPSRTADGQV